MSIHCHLTVNSLLLHSLLIYIISFSLLTLSLVLFLPISLVSVFPPLLKQNGRCRSLVVLSDDVCFKDSSIKYRDYIRAEYCLAGYTDCHSKHIVSALILIGRSGYTCHPPVSSAQLSLRTSIYSFALSDRHHHRSFSNSFMT